MPASEPRGHYPHVTSAKIYLSTLMWHLYLYVYPYLTSIYAYVPLCNMFLCINTYIPICGISTNKSLLTWHRDLSTYPMWHLPIYLQIEVQAQSTVTHLHHACQVEVDAGTVQLIQSYSECRLLCECERHRARTLHLHVCKTWCPQCSTARS